jgi:ABC-type multidrug transport system ATPase subunit
VSYPLLDADSVRIDAGGAPVVEQLTTTTTGSNLVVLGAPRVLYEACAGTLEVTSGTLNVSGAAPREALAAAAIASAPVDVALPPRWTLRDLVHESARLAGHPRREQDTRANAALHALGLDALARNRLAGVDTAVRRGAVIAAALATGAETIIAEDFMPGLPDLAARSLGRMFIAACEGRRWILFAGQLALSSPLGMHADEALLFAGGRFVCAGPPGEIATRERTFSLRTSGDGAKAFATSLRERGAQVEGDAEARALTVTLPDGFVVLDLLRMAAAGNVVVLELLPVSGTLV